ncbi:MAG: hypothetical protein V2A34_03605 [Lentisphaerota bacterium]
MQSKKTFIVIPIVLAAALSMACACLPLSSLERFFVNGQPLSDPPVYDPSTKDPLEPVSTCDDELGGLLSEAENSDDPGEKLAMEYILASYEVSGDVISGPDFPSSVPKSLESYQQDTSLHEEIWAFIVAVVPAEYRTEVAYFIVFTDGPAGTLGAVEQADDPTTWMLEMDVRDAGNFTDLSTTLVHEISHILTLNTSQVETDYIVFNNPDDLSAYEEGEAACDTYFMAEGCSYQDSYINLFFERYWGDIYNEWLEINQEQDEATLENRLSDFYGQYADWFVSDYAVTSPEEDIAESFMYFILAPQPAGDTIAEEKILFFYEFPELVTLRDQMRASLCISVMP